jgi:hypothetical protein
MVPNNVASLITSLHHKKQLIIIKTNLTATKIYQKMQIQSLKFLNSTYCNTNAADALNIGHGLQLQYEMGELQS